jgi:hypothetical protein
MQRQRLGDERHVGVDDGRARVTLGLGQAGLGQHPINAAVMHTELGSNGARPPVLDEVVAQNLRLNFFTDRQWVHPFNQWLAERVNRLHRRAVSDAATGAGQTPSTGGDTDDR